MFCRLPDQALDSIGFSVVRSVLSNQPLRCNWLCIVHARLFMVLEVGVSNWIVVNNLSHLSNEI